MNIHTILMYQNIIMIKMILEIVKKMKDSMFDTSALKCIYLKLVEKMI